MCFFFYLAAGAILENCVGAVGATTMQVFSCDVLQVFGEMPGPKSFLERSRAVGQLSIVWTVDV